MIYESAEVGECEVAVLADIDDLRQRLRHALYEPRCGRFYVATPKLRQTWLDIRGSRRIRDDAHPFAN
jgi:hypothetical protein